jgi:gamma-butyrobetaine dioxygenase
VIKEIKKLDSAILVIWNDDSQSTFPFIWLRDTDPLGFHVQTNERIFDLTSIDVEISPSSIELTETGIDLQWPNEERRSLIPNAHLAQYADECRLADAAQISTKSWQGDFAPSVFNQSLSQTPSGLKEILLGLKRDGLVIISNLSGVQGGEEFGDMISFKRETNFGVMFEVVNKADPNNLAYTAVQLPLHTDLSNQEMPPGYQFLHCIENNAQGGESVLADGFAIAQALKAQDPDAYALLCSEKMPFRFHDKDCDIRYSHPLISESEGEVNSFIFNAHLADCYHLKSDNCIEYYQAYQTLMREIRKEQYALKLKLKAGEMMIFDNKRVLHGRNSFDPATGDRHLRGYYIDHSEVDSKIRMLEKQ